MRVRYTPAALAHLREIGDYIARDNREAAKRVIQAIRATVELLRDNPDMGRRGHLEGTREMVIPRLPSRRLPGDGIRGGSLRRHPYRPELAEPA